MTPEDHPHPVHRLISEVLARRSDPGSAGWSASVRKGIAAATEVAAYGATERHLVGLPESARVGARRAAAICAGAPRVAHTAGTLGRCFAQLQRRATAGSIDSRINTIALLDVENAAHTFLALVRLAEEHHVGVNFYALADALAFWGDGISAGSQRTRQRLVADYYSAPTVDTAFPEGTAS